MRVPPARLVFIDGTSVKTKLTRLRGRCLRGERLEMNAPFGAWGTQTLIAGLTHENLIAPWVIKGAMDGEALAADIRDMLVPELERGTVIVFDNLATHKTPKPLPRSRRMAVGSPNCRHILLISIRLKWPALNSKHICAELEPGPSIKCSTHSPKSATFSRQKNAGTTSRPRDTRQVKGAAL